MKIENEKVIYVKKGNQEFLRFKKLLNYSDEIVHCYSVGIDKNYRTCKADKSKLPENEFLKNLDNYKTLCEANGLNYINIVKAGQAHTDNVQIINEKSLQNNPDFSSIQQTDGLITNKKNIILATTNADCILLLFFDPIKKVIANVHSGWKGTLQEISAKTVKKMKEKFDCNPKDVIVCISPCIRQCHFEVDKDVYEMFFNQFKKLGNTDNFIKENKGKWNIDTVKINKILLENEGILEENIEDSEICSVCNKDSIHSYRAEGENYGLATCLISLK